MRFLASAILVIASAVAAAPSAWAQAVGQATRVQRFAYQTPPQAQRYPLYRLNAVVRNARLDTVPSGALEVTFTDGSRLTLGSASSVIVDNYVYGGAASASSQTLRMTKGVFRFVSGSMPKDQVKLQTPNVTIGIRGTVVIGKLNEDNSGTIFFAHGAGFIDNGKTKPVQMQEGDMVKIDPNGNVGTPEQKSWSAGDAAVDEGLNPFGATFQGPDGGSGGGDGAGSFGGDKNTGYND